MPPAKKRKVTTTEKRKLPFPKQQQPGIQSFGRISKPQALPDIPSTKKGSEIVTVPVLKLEKEQVWSNGNKRKFETIEEESDVKEGLVEKKDLPVLRELKAKASDAVCQSVLVDSALQARAVEGKPTSDDHAGSHIGLDQLPRSSLPPTTPSPLPCQTGATPIDTPVASNKDEESDDPSQTLPEELQDMINLHSAFLTALSLHYAHNGSLTPADLRLLSPSIERAWGKRKVNLDDIRRLLGVLDIPATGGSRSLALPSRSAFRLSNYGGGKVCVEMRECSQKRGIMASHIDEDKLNTQFTSRLRYCWLHRKGLSSEDGNQEKKSAASEEPVGQSTYIPTYAELINTNSVAEFISKLPLAPIPICSSLSKISPTLSKGQLRLSDLKASAIKGKENSLKRQAIPSTSPSPKTTKDRGQGLMERIRAKELHQSTLPLPPSKSTLNRASAFQRLEEVIQVLNVLTNSKNSSGIGVKTVGQRVSFTLPALLQILQNSLRNPISREEAGLCMRLLAQEVAPGWVTVAAMGGVSGVVVENGRRPEMREIRGRIKRFCGV